MQRKENKNSASLRVLSNTGILYAKVLITMGISLYSTRLVLDYLGESDFGIFNLIAGIVAMLLFINAAMATSVQRYLSFHKGTDNFEMQRKVFTNSWILHIVIGLIIVTLLIALSSILFNVFLNIPADRISSAKKVYCFMLMSVFFTIISVPFTAALNARENMFWVAIVLIIESILKLIIALSLSHFSQGERLIWYSLFTTGISICSFFMYALYCVNRYEECNIKTYKIDILLLKELSGYSGWIIAGTFAWTGRIQGMGVILNFFFGTLVNAAYGIAQQVAGMLGFFSASLLRAFDPQIMKSEGMNDRKRMLRLSMMECKFCFFLISFIAIPFIFEMPAILTFWLRNVPDNAVIFCQLILVSTMSNQLTIGIKTAIHSTGRIKLYQILDSIAIFLSVPIAYFLFKQGFPAYWAFLVIVCTDILAALFRLLVLRRITEFSILEFGKRVIIKEIIPISTSILTCWLITNHFVFDYRFIATTVFSIAVFSISIYFTGMCKDEREIIDKGIKGVLAKYWKR